MISSDDEMTDSPPTTSFRRHDWSHDQLPYFGDRRDHKMTTSSPADTDQTVLSTTTSSDLSSSTTTGGDISNSLVDHLTTIPTRMKDVGDSKKLSPFDKNLQTLKSLNPQVAVNLSEPHILRVSIALNKLF